MGTRQAHTYEQRQSGTASAATGSHSGTPTKTNTAVQNAWPMPYSAVDIYSGQKTGNQDGGCDYSISLEMRKHCSICSKDDVRRYETISTIQSTPALSSLQGVHSHRTHQSTWQVWRFYGFPYKTELWLFLLIKSMVQRTTQLKYIWRCSKGTHRSLLPTNKRTG